MTEFELAHAHWTALPPDPLLLVPLGSTEQHGPHLPFNTDAVIATAVARGLAQRLMGGSESVAGIGFRGARDLNPVLGDATGGSAPCLESASESISVPVAPGARVVVARALNYGASGEHQGFPGTLSIGEDALAVMLVELARSARNWASCLVFVNGHGGNLNAVRRAVAQLVREGHRVGWVPCGAPGGDAHAGRSETSLMLHLDPCSVRMEAAQAGATESLSALMPALVSDGVHAVSSNGVLGDPTGATAAEGECLLEHMTEAALTRLLGDKVLFGDTNNSGLDSLGEFSGAGRGGDGDHRTAEVRQA